MGVFKAEATVAGALRGGMYCSSCKEFTCHTPSPITISMGIENVKILEEVPTEQFCKAELDDYASYARTYL